MIVLKIHLEGFEQITFAEFVARYTITVCLPLSAILIDNITWVCGSLNHYGASTPYISVVVNI